MPTLPDDLATLESLPIRALDYMKQGIDEIVERLGITDRTVARKQIRALNNLLRPALDDASTATPVYGEARAAWEGFSQSLDALADGADNFLRKTPETIRRELTAFRPRDQDFYRLCALQNIRDMV